jgi:hypothetical protein
MKVGTRQPMASATIAVSPSASPISTASVSMAEISSRELVPRDQYERTSVVASGRGSGSVRAREIALVRTIAPRS